jgi:O-acetyl-ADP-ribose deacetylase (regulator of RNase III)
MTRINYILGDATAPSVPGNKIIVHICNDLGAWGKGFVLALSRRWKEPEARYREWWASGENFSLGEVQFVAVEKDIHVANLIGQKGMGRDERGEAPIRYAAVGAGLEKVGVFAAGLGASVHMPRIGCGLAGGSWDEIEPLIQASLCAGDMEVYVYDLP